MTDHSVTFDDSAWGIFPFKSEIEKGGGPFIIMKGGEFWQTIIKRQRDVGIRLIKLRAYSV